MTRVDIGIASYQNPEKLARTIRSLRDTCTTDWNLLIVDNNSPDPAVREVVGDACRSDERISAYLLDENTGYAGAVNRLFRESTADVVVYCDNDAYAQTLGWDARFVATLEQHPEVALVGPWGYGAYPIPRDGYTEVLWTVGCFWALRRSCIDLVGYYDETLGHQEEVDYQMRLRMNGFRIASLLDVAVHHDAASSRNPDAEERITRGVINFVNKWCRYFCGANVNYHSPNVLRFEDWNLNALYLEEWWQSKLPGLNDGDLETVTVDGRRYVLLRVPRWGHDTQSTLYKGRIV